MGTVYILAATVFLPIFATLADVLGRYWALQSSLLIFMIGSGISAGSVTMSMMLVGRGVAGVGAGGLLTVCGPSNSLFSCLIFHQVAKIILTDSTSLRESTFATSMLVLLYALAYCAGPVIGGALTQISFRWIFILKYVAMQAFPAFIDGRTSVPCGAVSIILIFLLLRNHTKGSQTLHARLPPSGIPSLPVFETFTQRMRRIDFVGATLFLGAGILTLLGLNWGSTEKWRTLKVILSLILAGVLFASFMVWQYIIGSHASLAKQDIKDTEAGNTAGCARGSGWPDGIVPLALLTSYDICATQFCALAAGLVMLVSLCEYSQRLSSLNITTQPCFYFAAIYYILIHGQSPLHAGIELLYFAPGVGGGAFVAVWMISILKQVRGYDATRSQSL